MCTCKSYILCKDGGLTVYVGWCEHSVEMCVESFFKGQPNYLGLLWLWDAAIGWWLVSAWHLLTLGRPVLLVGALAGPGRWWAPLVLASEWTGGQLRPGPEFVRRPRRLGADLAATLLDWECPHQALQGVQDRQGPRQKLGWRTWLVQEDKEQTKSKGKRLF